MNIDIFLYIVFVVVDHPQELVHGYVEGYWKEYFLNVTINCFYSGGCLWIVKCIVDS